MCDSRLDIHSGRDGGAVHENHSYPLVTSIAFAMVPLNNNAQSEFFPF